MVSKTYRRNTLLKIDQEAPKELTQVSEFVFFKTKFDIVPTILN